MYYTVVIIVNARVATYIATNHVKSNVALCVCVCFLDLKIDILNRSGWTRSAESLKFLEAVNRKCDVLSKSPKSTSHSQHSEYWKVIRLYLWVPIHQQRQQMQSREGFQCKIIDIHSIRLKATRAHTYHFLVRHEWGWYLQVLVWTFRIWTAIKLQLGMEARVSAN